VACRTAAYIWAESLKAESIASHRHVSPWAAAAFVTPSERGQGLTLVNDALDELPPATLQQGVRGACTAIDALEAQNSGLMLQRRKELSADIIYCKALTRCR
jgi:hypothetical protein